ncbi:hypothetical protein V6N13_126617 [Hibiscus sabdariffa]
MLDLRRREKRGMKIPDTQDVKQFKEQQQLMWKVETQITWEEQEAKEEEDGSGIHCCNIQFVTLGGTGTGTKERS